MRFLAVAGTLDQCTPTLLYPDERADYEAILAQGRSALGEEVYVAAWGEGQAMTLEQAVRYALGDEE